MQRFRDEIFSLRDELREEQRRRKEDSASDDGADSDSDDCGEDSGSIVVTRELLESTLVPALKDLLQERDESSNHHRRNHVEEKKEASGFETHPLSDDEDSSSSSHSDGERDRTEGIIAILECFVAFAAATACAEPKPSQDSSNSPTQQSSYNSLSFRRTTTPQKKKKPRAPSSRERFSKTPQEDKDFFVQSGAFEMSVYLLRQILEDHAKQSSSSSWSRQKRADLDTFDSIGVADSSADVKIESTQPQNAIPSLVLHLVACLAHHASDGLKTHRILPHLSTVLHKSMMVFLPSPEVQAYGCWTLNSLSNPLLQELIAAGSVSVLVRAMKCHPSDARVQEHGNKSLYNLLPLLVYCSTQPIPSNSDHSNNNNTPSDANSSGGAPAAPPVCRIEIDGERLQDYSSLLPGLPAIVLRGMEFHPDHLAIQQYGLLVLTRLCKQEQEFYEIVVSEGGLMALLNVVAMATRSDTSSLQVSDHHNLSVREKHDCLAQMACQFLRDMSRPTNSSMDILRVIAIKGGIQTVLKLLDHYNQETLRCGGGGGSGYNYGNHQRFAIINIVDPAMACLRNLMTNEDNRSEVMTFLSMAKVMQQEEASQPPSGSTSPSSGQQDERIRVCADFFPIVLKTMDAYPLDAPIQAYGCDVLGRLAQGEESARLELIQTTIDPDEFSASERASRNISRLWKKADAASQKQSLPNNGSEEEHEDEDDEDAEIVDLSAQMSNSVISTSPRYKRNVDALVTAVRAMRSHRNHQGVQERAVTFILAMVIGRDAMLNNNNNSNSSLNSNDTSRSPSSSSSHYLIQRLEEVYHLQRDKDDAPTLLGFFQATSVPPKGIERLGRLTKLVERNTNASSLPTEDGGSRRGSLGMVVGWGWNKLSKGGNNGSPQQQQQQ